MSINVYQKLFTEITGMQKITGIREDDSEQFA